MKFWVDRLTIVYIFCKTYGNNLCIIYNFEKCFLQYNKLPVFTVNFQDIFIYYLHIVNISRLWINNITIPMATLDPLKRSGTHLFTVCRHALVGCGHLSALCSLQLCRRPTLLSGSLFSCYFITAACFSLNVPSDSLQWQQTAPKCNTNVPPTWDNGVPEEKTSSTPVRAITGGLELLDTPL